MCYDVWFMVGDDVTQRPIPCGTAQEGTWCATQSSVRCMPGRCGSGQHGAMWDPSDADPSGADSAVRCGSRRSGADPCGVDLRGSVRCICVPTALTEGIFLILIFPPL